MSNLSKHQRQHLALARRQLRNFGRACSTLRKEFRRVEGSDEFLGNVSRLSELLHEQSAAFENVVLHASLINSIGNRSTIIYRQIGRVIEGPSIYDYLTAHRKMVEHMGELDEWRLALALSGDIMEKAEPHQDDPKIWGEACEMSWRLFGAQSAIESLTRQAESLSATQDALLRSMGINFWQGHRRHLRWEGDRR